MISDLAILVTPENTETFVRLFLAMSLGAILGLERVFAKKSAGIRTYALVSMGSALFILSSEYVVKQYLYTGIQVNPLQVASNIVVGVGFLGAGIIIFKDSKLTGLTTAAGLWVVSAIGMAVGFGYYLAAFFTTIFTLAIFTLLWYVEEKLFTAYKGIDVPEER
ncbi:MAG: putative Mg2+ transporter-C (MgtC) family protein [Parcubacteria group bacterium LiPW_30]|nr:MAG: putative Mg2+ transporter-C (MgtC) family protein [Parcubacteria group bacterium LiPW_30]